MLCIVWCLFFPQCSISNLTDWDLQIKMTTGWVLFSFALCFCCILKKKVNQKDRLVFKCSADPRKETPTSHLFKINWPPRKSHLSILLSCIQEKFAFHLLKKNPPHYIMYCIGFCIQTIIILNLYFKAISCINYILLLPQHIHI